MAKASLVRRVCGACGKEFETPAWRVRQGKGRYCSVPCARKGSRKHGVEVDGMWFSKDLRTGYYYCKLDGRSLSLHRYLYEKYRGEIPEGYCIHHKDHNRENNDIDNLVCVPFEEHAKYHLLKRVESGELDAKRAIRLAQEGAKAWHRSKEGREWHRKHAKEVAAKRYAPGNRRPMVCTWCGKTYMGFPDMRKKGFCSPSCQGAARRASGVDDEDRSCVVCGSTFRANKYTKTKTCSKGCWVELLRRRRRVQSDGG